jgi:orotidine-5'-phosphate decarboxylase
MPTVDDSGPALAHAADRLIDAVDRLAAPACVGIDPVLARLPATGAGAGSAIDAIRSFTLGVLDATAGVVPCVKLQSACFERYGHAGVALLEEMMAAARERELVVILDAKRGDIGLSAEHYAAAAFGDDETAGAGADWITINAWLGDDGILPFLARGAAFALVRTSNPGGDAVQTPRLADGRSVAEAVAALVADLGRPFVGARGYSTLGAVVGATKPDDAARLRAAMPEQIFLVPGFGAQGAGVDDVRACFDGDGRGAIVTASRSVIYAAAVADAARSFADDVGRAAGMR